MCIRGYDNFNFSHHLLDAGGPRRHRLGLENRPVLAPRKPAHHLRTGTAINLYSTEAYATAFTCSSGGRRLQGGKRNKAERGELRFPLPVGLCWDEAGGIVLDPDQQVQGAVRTVFRSFQETGSAYGVAHWFAEKGLEFPKRAYGGVWDGKLIWGHLTDSRVLKILRRTFGERRPEFVSDVLVGNEIGLRFWRSLRNRGP